MFVHHLRNLPREVRDQHAVGGEVLRAGGRVIVGRAARGSQVGSSGSATGTTVIRAAAAVALLTARFQLLPL